MLGSEFRHSLDQKNRIFMPAKLREELGDTFVVAKSIRDHCLKVYSPEGWEAYIAPIRSLKRELSESVMRFLHSSMAQVSPDSQGRITLPQELVDHAKIEKSAVVVGCGDYAEIWSDAEYDLMKSKTDVAKMLADLSALGL